MNRRTPEEMKAYVDGYCDAVSQFCECIRKSDNIKDAVEKMNVFVNVVNAVVEKPENLRLAINLVEKNEEIKADEKEGEEKKQPCGKCIHFNRCWEEREFMYIEADKDGKCPRYKEGAEE